MKIRRAARRGRGRRDTRRGLNGADTRRASSRGGAVRRGKNSGEPELRRAGVTAGDLGRDRGRATYGWNQHEEGNTKQGLTATVNQRNSPEEGCRGELGLR
jgi:hypothetical protein